MCARPTPSGGAAYSLGAGGIDGQLRPNQIRDDMEHLVPELASS
jgi:hypothetical protein